MRFVHKFSLAVIVPTALIIVMVSALSGRTIEQIDAAAAIPASSGLRVLRSDQHGLVLELATPSYTLEAAAAVNGDYQVLGANGLLTSDDPGKPQLPHLTTMLGIPPGADVSVHVLTDDQVTLPGRYHLVPAPSPAPVKDDLQPGNYEYVPDAKVYATEALYPASPARVLDTAWLRDQRLARVEVSPFQYNPKSQTLVWHRRLIVEVRFDHVSLPSRAADQSPPGPFEPILRDQLLNYDVARAWRAAPQDYGAVQSALHTSYPLTDTTPRYKIVVDQDGVYRVSYADLQAAGMDVANIDPRTFHVTSQGRDVAIDVIGESDGSFDPTDAIAFYGQKFRGDIIAAQHSLESNNWMTYTNGWHPQFNPTMVERYTDENVYWLTVGGAPGPRMAALDGTPSGLAPTPDHYTATMHAEQVTWWRSTTFTGEDPFFWEAVTPIAPGVTTTRTYTMSLSSVVTNAATASVQGDVVAWSYNLTYHTLFYVNAMALPFEDSVWNTSAPTRHHFSGQVPQTELFSGINQLKFVLIPPGGMAPPTIYFDWFEVSYARRFEAVNDRLLFSGDQVGPRQYAVSHLMTEAVTILDVSDPFLPRQVMSSSVAATGGSYTATFEINASVPVTYYVSGADVLQSVKRIERYVPPDLSGGANGADYVIITHRNFYTAVQTLANYRAAQGLRVKVIDVDDVYNQFEYGIYHPIAIKDFLAYAYANWRPPAPEYVLLVGDGHWNFKNYPAVNTSQGVAGVAPNYMPPNISWVDPWQGEVDSANLLVNVAGSDPLPDVMVGRLPVNTITETNVAINKIMNYEQQTPPAWQQRLMFVADNVPDPNGAGDFVAMTENVIHNFVPPGLIVDRIYENNFGCGFSVPCPAVNYAITNSLNVTGALFVNYIGHASLNRWAHEQVFTNGNISTLTNLNQLPVILSMTCLDGYWFFPNMPGLMEEMLRAPNGGLVTSFSPTGLGVASGHDSLERGFFAAVFQDGAQEIGAATIAAKLALYATQTNFDLLHTFTVFGDPALRIATYAIEVTPTSDARSGTSSSPAVYTLQVVNHAYLTDTVTVSAAGNQWPVILPSPVTVPAGQSASFNVTVTVPYTAVLGAADRVTLTIASHGDETRVSAVLTTTNIAVYGVNLAPAAMQLVGNPGQTVTYTLRLTNTGNVASTFAITGHGAVWPINIAPSSVGPIGAGAGANVNVGVALNTTSVPSDTAIITATAQGGSSPSATARLITIAGTRHIFMPLVRK
jgi:hypothetical protein